MRSNTADASNPPTFAARRPAPRLRQLLEVADRDSSRDRIGRLLLYERCFTRVERAHRPVQRIGIAIASA